jgi:hypothetical protein
MGFNRDWHSHVPDGINGDDIGCCFEALSAVVIGHVFGKAGPPVIIQEVKLVIVGEDVELVSFHGCSARAPDLKLSDSGPGARL